MLKRALDKIMVQYYKSFPHGVFCQPKIEFIKYLESKGFIYIIAAPMSEILQKDIYRIRNWCKIDNGIQVAEFNVKHLDTN